MKKEYTISTYLLESQRLKNEIRQTEEYIDSFIETHPRKTKVLKFLDERKMTFIQRILLLTKDFKIAKHLLNAQEQKTMLEEEYEKNQEILLLYARKIYEIEKAHELSRQMIKNK